MAANTITRTFITANAWAWLIDGIREDGSPNVIKSDSVEFVSTVPNQVQAYKALKSAGIKCRKDMAQFDVVSEEVYALSVEDFLRYAVRVERLSNGNVKPIEG